MSINKILKVNEFLYLYKQGRFEDLKRRMLEVEPDKLNETDLKIVRFLSKKVDFNLDKKTKVRAERASTRVFKETKFFIVIPSYNSERYIEHTLDSVLANSGNNKIVLHVQDGYSSDATVRLVQNWFSENDNDNLELSLRVENDIGMYDAINRGIVYFEENYDDFYDTGSIFTWLNSDDLLTSNALTTVRNIVSSNEHVNWLTGIGSVIDESGGSVAIHDEIKSYNREFILQGFYDGVELPFIQQEGTFWKTQLFKHAGKLNSQLMLAGDWELWRRFAQYEALIKVDAILASHRKHPAQLSSDQAAYQREIAELRQSGLKYDTKGKEQSLRAVFESGVNQWNLITVKDEESSKHQLKTISLPKISVVVPTFNQGKYIGETLQSIIDQKYPNIELIVIDGGSTDETLAVVDKFSDHIDYFVSEHDKGQSDAINKGFSQATGEVFTWLNSDDQFLPDSLLSVGLEFALTQVDMVIGICEVYQDGEIVNRHLTSNDSFFPLKDILDLDSGWNAGQFVYQPEAFFTADLWHRAGGHVKVDHYYSMDYELWARFSLAEANIKVIGSSLINFRAHEEQKTNDPSKFKKELIQVRQRLIDEKQLVVPETHRPKPHWSRRLVVAFINDHGFKYGAGIAHKRMFAACEMGKNECQNFELNSYKELSEVNYHKLRQDLEDFNPDLIVIGNVHSSGVDDLKILSVADNIAKTFWVTHDFWAITGRCAYMGGCTKYLTGCDSTCPTPHEYPTLAPELIAGSWQSKYQILRELKNTCLLANSAWAAEHYSKTLRHHGVTMPVYEFTLGAPQNVFNLQNREEARKKFDLPLDQVVVGISVSSLSDKRKGAQVLFDALSKVNQPEKFAVLIIGNADVTLPDIGIDFYKTGYITNERILSEVYNAMDLYVGPSNEETFGQVFVEAGLCGTPSVGIAGTGTESSIEHGVTGWLLDRVRSGEKLMKLLNNLPDFARQDRKFVQLYYRNNFSLEKMYHSIFNVLRKIGLVDDLAIPNQISFVESPLYAERADGDIDFISGFSAVEGPYHPAPNFKFRWLESERGKVSIYSDGNKKVFLELILYNPIHERQAFEIFLKGSGFQKEFSVNKNSDLQLFKINLDLEDGVNVFDIVPKKMLDGSGSERRRLSFAVKSVNVSQAR